MSIEGVYFSTHYWPRLRTLWAYRFYPNGTLLFTYADPVGRFVFHTEAGASVCHPNEILGDKTKLPDFLRCFTRESFTKITYRSDLPAVTLGSYVTDGTAISLTHPYFHFPSNKLAGQVLPDRPILAQADAPITTTGKEKPLASQEEMFLRLDQ